MSPNVNCGRHGSAAFGSRLRALRKAAGKSQQDLARATRLAPTYLSKVETGALESPAEGTIARIAADLEIDPTELLVLAGKVPPDVRALILAHPDWCDFIRIVRTLGPEQWNAVQSD